MEKESKGSHVREFIKDKVTDWDDEVVTTARFKAFSGQKSDWEPRYLFWRDLILTIAHKFNFIFIKPIEIRNQWFSQGGLAPLCLDHVLVLLPNKIIILLFIIYWTVLLFSPIIIHHSIQHQMYIDGDIIIQSDMLDPRSGQLSHLFKKLSNLMGTSKKNPNDLLRDEYVVLASVLKVYAFNLLSLLLESSSGSILFPSL